MYDKATLLHLRQSPLSRTPPRSSLAAVAAAHAHAHDDDHADDDDAPKPAPPAASATAAAHDDVLFDMDT